MRNEKVEESNVKKAYWRIVEANTQLLDENKYLKERVERQEKVINKLLSRIATLEWEIEKNECNDIQRKVK